MTKRPRERRLLKDEEGKRVIRMENEGRIENPLGTRPLGKLLFSLAVPGIIANVVNALYKIVDQIFIGQGVGPLGNAATTIAFPLTTICMVIGLMAGIGSASGFNLELGKKNEEKARQIAGAAAGFLVLSGVIICALVLIFLRSMLLLFGATESRKSTRPSRILPKLMSMQKIPT